MASKGPRDLKGTKALPLCLSSRQMETGSSASPPEWGLGRPIPSMLGLMLGIIDGLQVPIEAIAAVVTALALAILCLWKDNCKLRTALIREKEVTLSTYRDLQNVIQKRKTNSND